MMQMMRFLTSFLMRRASWVLVTALLVTAVSAYYTARLYMNLRTDFEELLPTGARSVQDLAAVKDRMEATQNLGVLVFSDHPEVSKRFITDLSEAISRELPDLASHVEYRIDGEMRFFERRRALLMDITDLRRIRDYVRDRLSYEEEIRNPLNIFSGVEIPVPSFDRGALVSKYSARVSDYAKFKDGFYATPDGKIRVALVYLSGSAVGIDQALKLKAGIEGIVDRLDPQRYAPDLEVKYTGDVQNLIEERSALITDLGISTVVVSLLVVGVLLFYFKSLWATVALGASLWMGTLWTFGVSYFAVGYLNANSAFLGSIVLGNGINFGIVMLALYLEERKRFPHERALRRAMRGSMAGTMAAALAAGLAYGSLGLTSFRGFKQFGVIGLIGMALCWIASYTVLPAMLTWIDRRRSLAPRPRASAQGESHGWARRVARLSTGYPRAVLASGALVTVLLAVMAARQQGSWLETDTSQLRDRRSLTEGSGYLSKHLDEIFGRYLSPLVILPHTHEQTRALAREYKALQERQGSLSLISNVYSIHDFVPSLEDQRRKIAILREIQSMLPPRILRRISPEDARIVRDTITPESLRPYGVEDLPPMIRARFREKDGSVGKPVLVEPVFDPATLSDFANQKRLIEEVRAVAHRVDPGAAVVGQLPLTMDMIASISTDGPKATLFAFVAILVLSLVLFRRPAVILQAILPLCLGVAWMVLAARAAGLKINFLNFIALPIAFNIGVDYGVNLLSRIRQEGARRIVDIVATTGSAVALASATTVIGYSSLLMAGNQGFVSFGRLAVLGELTSLAASVLMLPAFLQWQAQRRERAAALSAGQGVSLGEAGDDRSNGPGLGREISPEERHRRQA
jgi:predicted RND superfamily exporter protein